MKSIIVTGAAGFIGSHLTEKLLGAGFKVIGIDNFDPFYKRELKEDNLKGCFKYDGFRFIEADIRRNDLDQLIKEEVDLVIHLAAKAGVLPSIKDPESYISTNISGTFNMLEMMKKKGIRKMVFSSSSSVYGNNKKTPFSESDSVDNPISPYAFTKKACELMNYNYHYLYQMDVINLRFFTVYGPRQRPDLAIHKFVKLIDEGKQIEMYGDGSSARDYTYISDIVEGISKAAEYILSHDNIYEIINIGNHSPVTLKELVSRIFSSMKISENVRQVPFQQGDVDVTYADISKAKKFFNYNPSVSIDKGLKNFIDWYIQNKKND